jgi:phosphoribosylaminoimidazole-succinocarboxamide synthase
MKYDQNHALLESAIPGLPPPRRGKVRDVYDLGDTLLFVASDRLSAFDVVMPNGIPDKGRILTAMSKFWFASLPFMQNHLISMDVKDFPAAAQAVGADLEGRSMLVRKTKVMQIECIARGYLVGSGWKEYQKNGTVCGIELRPGYRQAEKLDHPIFTPSTKADQGHDENISYATCVGIVGPEVAAQLRDYTLKIYSAAAEIAAKRGIIIADTKLEFGILPDGKLILVDEVLTPDSSRFWPADQYQPGGNPPSLDKQFVRDWLEAIKFNKTPPGPVIPDDIVMKTRDKYLEAVRLLTGNDLV